MAPPGPAHRARVPTSAQVVLGYLGPARRQRTGSADHLDAPLATPRSPTPNSMGPVRRRFPLAPAAGRRYTRSTSWDLVKQPTASRRQGGRHGSLPELPAPAGSCPAPTSGLLRYLLAPAKERALQRLLTQGLERIGHGRAGVGSRAGSRFLCPHLLSAGTTCQRRAPLSASPAFAPRAAEGGRRCGPLPPLTPAYPPQG